MASPSASPLNSYVVLARKWRPAQFSDIVGQLPVVRTLSNAISSGRIHQAYLFTGSRGIGKTSIARIFAKALRCPHLKPSSKTDDQTAISCDECASCREIANGSSVDVLEIDGASNNGVDAVREIRENAKYLPASGNRKIYIIDEVHMLTTAAFNALLKTLEEPPAHVIFVFATTEPHKIPATILSRCQRFDFKRVSVAQIQERLEFISKQEKVTADPAALTLVARSAEGSMRDALSLLDQVIAFSGDQITPEKVREAVGLIGSQTLLGVLNSVYAREPIEALGLVERAYQQGHDLRVLTRSLLEMIHASIFAKIGMESPPSLQLSSDEWSEIQRISSLRELEEMELIFQVLHHGVDWIARSPQPKQVLDVLLIKCATAEALFSVAGGGTDSGTNTQREPVRASVPRTAQSAPAKPVTQQTGKPMGDSWEAFIGYVRKSRPLLASILENGSCPDFPGQNSTGELKICFPPHEIYFKEQLQSRAYHEQLQLLTKEFFGRAVRIQIEQGEIGESLAKKRERERQEKESAAKDAVNQHPIINEAKSLFGGELGPIEVLGSDEEERVSSRD